MVCSDAGRTVVDRCRTQWIVCVSGHTGSEKSERLLSLGFSQNGTKCGSGGVNTRMNIHIENDIASLIPPLSADERAALETSLLAEGCRDALVVWKGQDVLVDGHNRIRWCREKGYAFPVVEKEFADKDAVKAYVLEAQLGRRNLSPAAESYLRGKRYLEMRHQGQQDSASGHSDPKRTSERLGEEFAVGEKTIRRDARFAEAVDAIVAHCGADARNLLLVRDTAMTRGGVLRIARLGPAEQREFLRALKESGKRPRGLRQGKKREKITLPAQPRALVEGLLKQLGARELSAVYHALGEAIGKQGPKESARTQQRPGKQRARREK